jgi:hypothetical protein
MRTRPPHTGGPATTSPVLSLVLAATVALAALVAVWDAGRAAASAAEVQPSEAPAPSWAEAEAPDPVTVRSEAVDIESPMIPLGKQDDGRLEVPEDAHTAGWWTGRANPGERGPAVIVGHVDSREGPGAFWELPDLREGDVVAVDREDGTSLDWVVDRVETHPKDDFPTDDVYGATEEPTLRLITCSGFFDPQARSYDDNTIVFLTLDEGQDLPAVAVASGEADPSGADDAEGSATVAAPSDGRGSSDVADATAHTRAADTRTASRQEGAGALSDARDGDRGTPIALAALSVLGAGGAVLRELRATA